MFLDFSLPNILMLLYKNPNCVVFHSLFVLISFRSVFYEQSRWLSSYKTLLSRVCVPHSQVHKEYGMCFDTNKIAIRLSFIAFTKDCSKSRRLQQNSNRQQRTGRRKLSGKVPHKHRRTTINKRCLNSIFFHPQYDFNSNNNQK